MELTPNNITHLLQPFPGETPAGEDIEYLPLFEQISQARENDDATFQDDMWTCEVRQTDWLKVSTLCIQALEQHGKDLQVASWLTQAQGKLYGLTGIGAGLHLITGLCENFWPTLWPQLDEEGGYGADMRLGQLSWLDNALCQVLEAWPLTDDGKLTMMQWARVQHFEHSIAINATLRAELESDGYFGMNECENSIRSSSVERLQTLMTQVHTLESTFQTLQGIVQNLCGEGAAVLASSQTMVTKMRDLLTRFHATLAPNEVMNDALEVEKGETSRERRELNDARSHHDNRTQAIGQMLSIANYFRRNEPTSPVPYLLERAARWANMGMAEWLNEMLEDNTSVLREIMRVIKGPENQHEQDN
ncbi:type VI secretion system protein TssA [Serratia fonticola]|uniref:type VI secretion system protein TssA n=1 Tax=Serratia fonticola TaxID=47917 RepID=UPI0004069C0C|nr:type VI secretion system protein TssA [Serratia fonticola]